MTGESRSLELPHVEWRRVSPRYIVAELIGLILPLLLFPLVTVPLHLIGSPLAWLATGAVIALVALYAVFTPRRVRAIGYQLRDDDLIFGRGILSRRVVAVPYGRMQLVDINRGPLSRALGLSELKLVTAAATSGVVIPGLREADADELRDKLIELAESRRAGL